LVAAPIPEHARGKPIKLWWQNEARIGQQGSLTYVWADKGSLPRAPGDQRYDWAYLLGVVGPARGVGAALVLPFVNTEAMNLHLAEISSQVTPDAHAVITLNGAGWHRAGDKLEMPDNLSLLALPPYSPELNPVENIWQFLRQNHLSNHNGTIPGKLHSMCDTPGGLGPVTRRRARRSLAAWQHCGSRRGWPGQARP
jgi:hypothetical protein